MMINRTTPLLIIFIFLISCTPKLEKSYIDITPPQLSCHLILENRILFQFDEPIMEFELLLTSNDETIDTIKILPNIPKNNFFIDDTFFKKKYSNMIIKVADREDNRNLIELKKIIINKDRANPILSLIQLKHSKKSNQRLKLVNTEKGSLDGTTLTFLFANGKKIEMPFIEEEIEKSNELNIEIIYNKNSNYKNELLYSKKYIRIELSSRLSDNYGAILIKDYKNNITDYILYYNSKKNDLDKLNKKNNYLKIVNEIKNEENIDFGKIVDINGISIKKPIVRNNGRWFIIK